jgi:hypothetical protein
MYLTNLWIFLLNKTMQWTGFKRQSATIKRFRFLMFCLLLFTSFIAKAGDLVVSGITGTYADANGVYKLQGVLARSGVNYWKHESKEYYIYYDEYNTGTTWYYWNIDNDLDDETSNLFYSNMGPSSTSPLSVTDWYDYTYLAANNFNVELKVAINISDASATPAPEMNLRGNTNTIVSGDNTPSYADYTKFGSAEISVGTASRTFTIENTGSLALTVGNITISGTHASCFSVTSKPSSSVAASGSTTFTITYTPSAVSDQTAEVTIVDDDADENPYSFTISGYGFTRKNLVVSGSTYPEDANGTYIYQGIMNEFQYWKHKTLDYYLVNYSQLENASHTWAIDNNFLTTDGYPFYCPSEANMPTGLTWSLLSFTPTGSSTSKDGAGTIVITEETAVPEINIKGAGYSINDGSTTPIFYNNTSFGTLDISSGSRVRSFTIENLGTAALNLSGSSPFVTITGSDASSFSVTAIPSNSIAASASTSFEVTFKPTTEGSKTAVITIQNNDNDEGSYDFTIQGNGIVPKNIVVSNITSPSDANGTYIYQGLSSEFQYWKSSNGNYYIYNYRKVSNYNPVWFIGTNILDDATYIFKSINSGESVSPVGITSWGVSSGNTGNPVITYAEPEIKITGNNLEITSGDVTPSVYDYTDFDNVETTSGTMVKSFSIQNTGTEALKLTSASSLVTIGGTNAADFTVTTAPLASIDAGSSSNFQITFNPSALGLRSATISIANNDADENPYTFSIQGTGLAFATLTTNTVSNIGVTSATLGGNITDNGGAAVTERGVVYSTSNNTPAIGVSGVEKVVIGSGNGTFSTSVITLSAGTKYYVRAYAITAAGTSYSSIQSFTTLNKVNAIKLVNNSLNNLVLVSWEIQFEGSVTGLSSSNFALVNTGLTSPSIASVTGSGTTWTVSVNTGAGSGYLGLNLINTTGLSADISNSLPFIGELYTIDKVLPFVSITSTATEPTKVTPVPVIITFTEPVTGFSSDDITVTNGTISDFGGSDASYTCNIVPIAQGKVTVDIDANIAQDAAGNNNTAATQLSRVYNTNTTGIENASVNGEVFSVYPNPVRSEFTLSAGIIVENALVCICDLQGHVLKQKTFNGDKAVIDASSLSGGVYIVKVAVSGQVFSIKMFKE